MMTVRDLGLNNHVRDPDLPSPLDQDTAVWKVVPPDSKFDTRMRYVDTGGILEDLSTAIGPPTAMCVLGDNVIGVAGWEKISLAQQYRAVTEGAGAFVASNMLYLRVAGPDAPALLNMLSPREVRRLEIGQAMFTIFTTHAGTVDEEAVVLRTGRDEYLVSCGGGKMMTGLSEALNTHSRVIVEESDIVSFNIKGPGQTAAMQALVREEHRTRLATLQPFQACRARTAEGDEAWVLKTTVGIEMWGRSSAIRKTWRQILEQPALATPCAWDVLNVFRLECTSMVFAVYPMDIHEGVTLWEGGYGWMIEKEDDFFIGQEALRQSRGRERIRLVGLMADDVAADAPALGTAINNPGGEIVGYVTSSAFSIKHQRALAFAHLKSEYHPRQARVLLGQQEWRVNPLPFNRGLSEARMLNEA